MTTDVEHLRAEARRLKEAATARQEAAAELRERAAGLREEAARLRAGADPAPTGGVSEAPDGYGFPAEAPAPRGLRGLWGCLRRH
jgi:hypothetical protein